MFRTKNRILHCIWHIKEEDFFGGGLHGMTVPLTPAKMSLWASARKFLTALCRKMLDLLKDVRAIFPAIQASVVFLDFLKNNSNTSKSSLACSCQTPGVGVQACSNKILLNSADAASPPSLLLFTIPPTPRWSCCRLCWAGAVQVSEAGNFSCFLCHPWTLPRQTLGVMGNPTCESNTTFTGWLHEM